MGSFLKPSQKALTVVPSPYASAEEYELANTWKLGDCEPFLRYNRLALI